MDCSGVGAALESDSISPYPGPPDPFRRWSVAFDYPPNPGKVQPESAARMRYNRSETE
jgi:hypothetical protein